MLRQVNANELEAFCEVNVVESLNEGILNISKGHGIAGLKTNTVMFGWSEEKQANINQLNIIRELSYVGKNIVLAKFNDPDTWKVQQHQRIDIWWSGRENNGDLMLILAYMLKLNPDWEHARIHIRAIVENDEEKEILSKGIEQSLAEARIPATVQILINKAQSFSSILKQESSDADIVFMGLQVTAKGEEEKHAENIEKLAQVGKVAVFVQNNSLKETFPVLLRSENR